MTNERFPLSWPNGWVRTPRQRRQRAAFRSRGGSLTVHTAIGRLSAELSRLGATSELLSTSVPVRLDGLPRSGQADPDDTGAAVYFKLKGKDLCLACDKWHRVADNIAALAQHIDALRRIDRYGVGKIEQAFAGYTALPPTAMDWWLILGISQQATHEQIESAFRAKAMTAHPDRGGDHETMAQLNAARKIALGRA